KKDGGYVDTNSIRAIHCKHLTRIAAGLPAPCPESAKCAGRCTEHDTDAGAIQTHDYVRINAPHHKGYGLVKSIHDCEMVPDVEEDVLGTSENPAARVKCYKAMENGFVPTNHHVGHYCKHLEKVPPPPPPSPADDQGKASNFTTNGAP